MPKGLRTEISFRRYLFKPGRVSSVAKEYAEYVHDTRSKNKFSYRTKALRVTKRAVLLHAYC